MEQIEEDEDEEVIDSGPFCRHWSDPVDCEHLCSACGHRCGMHDDMLHCFHEDDDGKMCECSGYQDVHGNRCEYLPPAPK
jgi:hypothetical protein